MLHNSENVIVESVLKKYSRNLSVAAVVVCPSMGGLLCSSRYHVAPVAVYPWLGVLRIGL